MTSLRLIVFAVICLPLMAAATSSKQESPVQRAISACKAQGIPYSADLWYAAEAEFRALEDARRLLPTTPVSSLDDGGATWQTATMIMSNPFTDNGTTVGKGNEGSLPSCLTGGNDNAEDAWYTITTTDSILLTIWTTCESGGPPSYDTRLGIFNSSMTLVGCNDDAEDCGDPWYQSRIVEQALIPGTYYVIVDGYDGDSGPYRFNATWEVGSPCTGGSNAANAEVITGLPFTDTGSTVDECDDIRISCELAGVHTADDYWYRINLNVAVLLDVSTVCSNTSYDTKIAILDDQYWPIYCNDDDPMCPTFQSTIENAAVPAGTYFIVVDGYLDAEGPYTIHVDTTHWDPTGVTEWAPDITIRASDLYDTDIVNFIVPGRRHLRLSNGTPNDALGNLHVYGVFPPHGDGTQDVMQRVYRSDGSFYNLPSGTFVYHPAHDHIHLEDWCLYRLRTVLPDSGVGPVVAEGQKTSFCIMDLAIYNTENPNFDPSGQYLSCATTVQGISAGWVDIYHKELPGQNIDITDLPDGQYWLEAEADPDNHIYEASETNNINRVIITVGDGAGIPDAYEPNNTPDLVDQQPVGGSTSPNLGPTGPETVIPNLTIHTAGDEDFYRFYACHTGGPADYIRAEFEHNMGNIGIRLLDASRAVLQTVNGASDEEILFLNTRPEGWYYIDIFSDMDTTGQVYTLTINPPSNASPSIAPINPPFGNVTLMHGLDTYTCTWTNSDPESDQMWVTLYMNNVPELNGNQFQLVSSVNTPAENGFVVVNSAYFEPGSYYFYFEVTDGGTRAGTWSAGTVTWLGQAAHKHPGSIPDAFHLAQNYPNPFNPVTTIEFGLRIDSEVSLKVFDIQGREVRTLVDGELKAGHYETPFVGTTLPAGMYFYRLISNEGIITKKMVLLK